MTGIMMRCLIAGCLLCATHAPARGESSYRILWSSIDGGGGTLLSGGGLNLAGTIGQPDVGEMTGGAYTLGGGILGGGSPQPSRIPGETIVSLPLIPHLFPCCPNPTTPWTTITFQLPVSHRVILRIYSTTGRLVRTLLDENRFPGAHSVTWNGMSERGVPAASGVYFVRLQAGEFSTQRKLVLVY
ncbi:MAG: T9SS type A sorting domain-containing protein [Candidatus Eisenbacteria sp.]|nr:T9SS type A sorting domain-containing protein [Candidatus Eisenbacteria bacterium]